MLKKTIKKKKPHNNNSNSKDKPQKIHQKHQSQPKQPQFKQPKPQIKPQTKHKKVKSFHQSNCSLLQDPSISELFKNQALKKKHPTLNPSQINFSSTINNYTSVYTVISSVPHKVQKTKSSKNITKQHSQINKKKPAQKAKSKSKLNTQPNSNKEGKKKKQQQRNSQKLQSYELIPPSKNSLNSQIVFSIEDTKRECEWQQKRKQQSSRIYDSLMRVSQQNLINNNKLLRSTIKQEFKRKNEAATKIQKVFRGYLTRKILRKYIQEEQQKLYGLLENYKSSTRGKRVKERQQVMRRRLSPRGYGIKMQEKYGEREYFDDSNENSNYNKSKNIEQQSPGTFKDQQQIQESKVGQSNFDRDGDNGWRVWSQRVHSNRFFSEKRYDEQIVNCEDEVMSSEGSGEMGYEGQDGDEVNERLRGQGVNNRGQMEKQENEQQSQQSQLQSQQSSQIIVYRHQQAIYNGTQIQQYLQSSSQQQQQDDDNLKQVQNDNINKTNHNNNINGHNNKQKIPQIISQKEIIFETYEQHIQSRKNSLLNKEKNGDKATHHQSILNPNTRHDKHHFHNLNQHVIAPPQPQQPSDTKDLDLIKTSKANSIHSHLQSQKDSIKSSQAVSPKTKNQILQSNQNYLPELPSERTSKKQCKKTPISQHNPSLFTPSQSNKLPNTLTLTNPTEHMNTVKLQVAQKYSPPNIPTKQSFMDTISYNTQFKAKHQISLNQELQAKKKDSIKKKIYYFSDEQQSHQLQESAKKRTPRSGRSGKSGKSEEKGNSPNQLERLKNLEMQRWDQVIKLMNCQLKDMNHTPAKSKQFESFIKQVMNISLKNKEILKDMMSNQSSFNKSQSSFNKSQGTFKNSRIDQILEQKETEDNEQKLKKWKDFKQTLSSGRRKSITEQDIAIFKPNSRVILSNKHAEKQMMQKDEIGLTKGRPFFMQPKKEIKQKLSKIESDNYNISESQTREFKLMNIQNEQIQQMLRIRQQMLQKRECQQLSRLNEQLIRKQVSQRQFLSRLKKLTETFQIQKVSIDGARQDIAKGYSAAMRLIRQAYSDARKIGYKLPMSRSSESYKLKKMMGLGVLGGIGNRVIIDQLNNRMGKQVRQSREQLEIVQKIDNHLPTSSSINKQQQVICDRINRLTMLQVEYLDSKQFTRSQSQQLHQQQKVQFNHLLNNSNYSKNISNNYNINNFSNNNSQNFSQSSSSIIHNLTSSQNSFQHPFLQPQISPKHQQILHTPQSLLTNSNIFTQNQHEFDDDISQQSSQIQFSEQQLNRFRKAQPYDPSIADMNRNLMIGKQFFQMQKFSHHQNSPNQNIHTKLNQDPENLRMRLYRQVYEIQEHQMDSLGCDSYPSKSHDPKNQLIAEKQLQFLIFEMATQILMKPLFSEKFLQPKRQEMFGIRRVSDECRKDFIRLVQNLMPKKEQIFVKINQNISPLPRELLKCMRIDFSEDQEEDNEEEYEEIGKYEMILDQQMCNMAIEKYHERMIQEKENKMEIDMLTGENLQNLRQQYRGLWPQNSQQKIFGYLQQRQKFVSNRKQHCESIRWQFINMQLHCLFDAWNEQIIQLKNNRNGYSGIGLNELTLSMIDRNRRVREEDVEGLMEMSRFKLMKVLNYQEEIIDEINYRVCREVGMKEEGVQEFKEVCSSSNCNTNRQMSQSSSLSSSSSSMLVKLQQYHRKYQWVYRVNKQIQQQLDTQQQSRWVYYADEALSYGLQLVYLIEEELFGELGKDLRKLMIKGGGI